METSEGTAPERARESRWSGEEARFQMRVHTLLSRRIRSSRGRRCSNVARRDGMERRRREEREVEVVEEGEGEGEEEEEDAVVVSTSREESALRQAKMPAEERTMLGLLKKREWSLWRSRRLIRKSTVPPLNTHSTTESSSLVKEGMVEEEEEEEGGKVKEVEGETATGAAMPRWRGGRGVGGEVEGEEEEEGVDEVWV